MRRLAIIIFCGLTVSSVIGQDNKLYQTGITAEQNLKAIGSLNPNSTGGVGFDTRYEGVIGSPRLFDRLLPSFLRVTGQENYIQLETDIDVMENSLLFINPKTDKLVSLPSDNIEEVIISDNGKELKFRTTDDKYFKNNNKEKRFYQVLKDGPFQFIKIPGKKFIEASYKGGYSSDRRFDEYRSNYRYFIMNSDSLFQPVRLTKKSLSKLFPERKVLIKNFESKSDDIDEEEVVAILEKF